MNYSEIMLELRNKLDAHNIPWQDASEEIANDGYCYHMERTKVYEDGVEIASCIWGWTEVNGNKAYHTYGAPYLIETMSILCNCYPEPEPRTVDEIVNCLVGYFENKEAEQSHRCDDDFPCKKIYRNLCPYCGHEFNAVNSENYCPNCGRGMVE